MDIEEEVDFQDGKQIYQFNITPRAAPRRTGTSWARNVFKDSSKQTATHSEASILGIKKPYVAGFLWVVFVSILEFIRQVVMTLQRPMSLLTSLIIYNQVLAPYMGAAVADLLHPLCYLPVVGRICPSADLAQTSPVPSIPATGNNQAVMWADYPALIDLQNKAIDQLYAGGTEDLAGSSLSSNMRRSQMATSDLVVLVNISDFMGKTDIANILSDIATISKDLAKGLTGLEVGVIGAVNRIHAANNFAINHIERARSRSLMTVIGDFFSNLKREDQALAENFDYALSVLGTELSNILVRCDTIQALLDLSDAKLNLLYELLQREQIIVSAEKDEFLAELWTKLGGNRRKVHDITAKSQLLRDLIHHRREVQSIVAVITQGVGILIEDLEQLRTRVVKPAIEGSVIPTEVQLQSIKAGVERIQKTHYFMQHRRLGSVESAVFGDQLAIGQGN